MTEDVDRNRVLQTTRVRTSLKNDVSWIHTSKPENKQQNNASSPVETKPVTKNSYVLSTARKFDDSTKQANGEVFPPQKETQDEGPTMEITEVTKPQVPTEEPIQNGAAQPETLVGTTAAENKEDPADTAVDKTNVEQSEVTAGVSVDVPVEDCLQNDEAQPIYSTKEKEAASSVEPVEQPVADTTAEHACTAVDQSNIEHNDGEVSADAHVVAPFEEPTALVGMEESKDDAEAPAVLAVKVNLHEEPSIETEPANAANLVDAEVEPNVELAGERYEKLPAEQAAKEIVEAVAEVVTESSPDKSVVINATPGEEDALQEGVEPVPDLAAELPTQPAAETTADGKCEKGPPEQAVEETVEAVTEINIESLPETPAVTEAAREETDLPGSVEPVPDFMAGTISDLSSTQPADETMVKSVECKAESAATAEPVSQARAEKIIECEVQPADNTTVEQSVEPTPESAADCVVELSLEDAVKPAPASEDKLANGTIELTDALDVEPPTDAAPEPLKDPEQSQTVEENLNQQSDHTSSSETFQKPKEEQSSKIVNETRSRKDVCSFCEKVITGNIKIIFSEPLVNCHPDCLKCGLCAKALGDLLTPMFLHNQVIQCDVCFAKTLKT